VIEQDDKVSLTRKRVELVESLTTPLPTEERVRIQGEISVINAKLKAINTTTAAQLKADADRRKVAGLAEAQANAQRARAKVNGSAPHAPPNDEDDEDDDPSQTEMIDGWIDAVLLRHDVDFARTATGDIMLPSDPSLQKLVGAIYLFIAGIHAAARGQELPDLPPVPPVEGRYVPKPKPKAAPKAKPKKR
jgi:hypothetical protein